MKKLCMLNRDIPAEGCMLIRSARPEDLEAVSAVEAECFPAQEAATKESFEERIRYYGDCFTG